jgi:hypothetical protein
MLRIMPQPEKVHVRVWERRSTSRGGQYFLVVRRDALFPIEKLGTVEQRGELGRGAFHIEATLEPDDLILHVDFSNSGHMDIYSCEAREMRPDEHGLYYTTWRRADTHLPKWLRKRIGETLRDAAR